MWLHAGEDRTVIDLLLDHTLHELSDRPVEAFAFATALGLGLGLEALAVRHRPTTTAALAARGFTGSDLWRYMCADLPLTGLPRTSYSTSTAADRRTFGAEEGLSDFRLCL